MPQKEEPKTKKMAEAIEWSKNAGKDVERYFSAGGFEAPNLDTFLEVECPECGAAVDVIWDSKVRNAECPLCDTKVYYTSKRHLVAGVKVNRGTAIPKEHLYGN